MEYSNLQAHVFDSMEDAQAALSEINSGEGFSPLADQRTKSYTTITEKAGQYYIKADSVTRKYLTEEQTIQIEYELNPLY